MINNVKPIGLYKGKVAIVSNVSIRIGGGDSDPEAIVINAFNLNGEAIVFLLAAICLPMVATAGDAYKITGQSGNMFFVAVDTAQKDNEDVYCFAVEEACAGKAICQVQFWVGSASSGFPLT